jgi:flagellar hook capping protein FlgD
MCAHEGAGDGRGPSEAQSSRLRRTGRGVGSILLLVTPMLLAACAKDNITRPRTYTLTGQVRLVGALRNGAGDSTDVQRVENADSVRVYLYQGPTLEDSTRTTSGGYRFDGLSGGPYSVVTVLWGEIGDAVSIGTVTADMAADTLVLQSSPTMIGFPNPFTGATAVRFSVPAPSAVEVIARKPSGLTVRSLAQVNLPAGYHEVGWDATDDSGSPVPVGPYWILYREGLDHRCRLVVKV